MTTTTSCTTHRAKDGTGIAAGATITDGVFSGGSIISADCKIVFPFGSLAELDGALNALADVRAALMEASGLKDS